MSDTVILDRIDTVQACSGSKVPTDATATSIDRAHDASSPSAATRAHLLVNAYDGTWTSYTLPTIGSVTIGSGPEATIRLLEASISPLHARLEIDGGDRFRLSDLGSANGTFVGAVLLHARTALVHPGQPILLGHSLLVIQAPCSEDRDHRRAAR